MLDGERSSQARYPGSYYLQKSPGFDGDLHFVAIRMARLD